MFFVGETVYILLDEPVLGHDTWLSVLITDCAEVDEPCVMHGGTQYWYEIVVAGAKRIVCEHKLTDKVERGQYVIMKPGDLN